MPNHDFDLLVVGHETEGCLAAVAAARAGARVGLLHPDSAMLGGLLTEDGLAFVDRDARHLVPPQSSPRDGIFAEFLRRAGVPLVALPALTGHATLAGMLANAGVTRVVGEPADVVIQGRRLAVVKTGTGDEIVAKHFIDATPDADLAELTGMRFETGFRGYGDDRTLGVSPLPVLQGVSPEEIIETCERLQGRRDLENLRKETFGDRQFLALDHGADYVLVGPPHLGLAYQQWREERGFGCPHRFEADGFNVAVVGPKATSWNGLIYFVDDPAEQLRLSRHGMDAVFQTECERFLTFVREELDWQGAGLELPRGVYVRQTRHALDVRHRLTLAELAAGYDVGSVGTFSYYADFRGFHSPKVPGPVTAHVIRDAGLAANLDNLGLACRSGGYTPFAHSICRLVQYNVTLGAALGVTAALAKDLALHEVPVAAVKDMLELQHALADDPTGFDRNAAVAEALAADPIIARETA